MDQNKGYKAFSDYAENKTFSLIGLGVSNLPLVSFLLSAGAKKVTVRDLKKTSDSPEVKIAVEHGADVILGENYLCGLDENIIIRSPGIRPDIPPFLEAKSKGARITCETELFLEFCPVKTIAVTGSDGKTTTTTLISKILTEAGYSVFLGGNIGKAMLPQLIEITNPESVCVMELSSFQLMECQFSPDISVITNLSENHLDWHRNMDEYLDAKKNILRHQTCDSVSVLNFDNEYTRVCDTKGKKIFFARKNADDVMNQLNCNAVYTKNGDIYLRCGENETLLFGTKEIKIPGEHNVENYMAAIAATFEMVDAKHILNVARTFGGVEHRIEFVRELDGVKYYNSSIDSSPARSKAALSSFSEKVIMIAGGYDKNLDYSELGDIICHKVKVLILCGATANKILYATKNSAAYSDGSPKILLADNFDEAVRLSATESQCGDTVVLSPASASFDLFRNFEERGRRFKELVKEL